MFKSPLIVPHGIIGAYEILEIVCTNLIEASGSLLMVPNDLRADAVGVRG